MTPLLDALDPAARLLVQALVNTLWPGFLLIAMTYLTLRVSARASAATRHAIWLVALAAFCALPALPTGTARISIPSSTLAPPLGRLSATLTRPASSLAPLEQRRALSAGAGAETQVGREAQASADEATDGSALKPAGSEIAALDLRAAEADAQDAQASAGAQPGAVDRWLASILGGRMVLLLAAVWAVIAAFLLARIIWSYVFLMRLRKRLGLLPAAERARGQELAEIYGLRRRVRFFTSTAAGVPMTMGWLRPLVVLPPDVVRTLSAAELDSILAHELAHIKRWDYLVNLLQRVAQAIFFFHPAVWIIGRELAVERELACDDWALKLTGEPRRYATCLTKMVEVLGSARPFAAATGIIFGKHVISRRIEMILNGDRNATTSVSKSALLSSFATAGLAVAMCTLFAPVFAVPRAERALMASLPAATQSAGANLAAQGGQTPTATAPRPAAPVAPAAPSTSAPLPPAIALVDPDLDAPFIEEPVIELLDTMAPVTIASAPMAPVPARSVSLVNVSEYAELLARSAQQSPPVVAIGRDSNSPPLIPESELLAVLTDIVKRDSDPSVRQEALRGIYRIRTEAGTNALLSLYDSIPDAKTKGEIIEYLMRREGDNSKAVAKLVQIAKTEKDETLRSRALRQLSRVKGDEGAGHLISIYDGLQDPKEKQMLIRYLGYNKSRKAVDKLIQIAKTDTDPGVRQSAIRSLYAIDHNLYLDVRRGSGNISKFFNGAQTPFVLDQQALEAMQEDFKYRWTEEFNHKWNEEARERVREALESQSEHMERAREALEELREKQPDIHLFWPEVRIEKEKTKPAPKSAPPSAIR